MPPVYYPLDGGTYFVEATAVTSDTITQFQGRIQRAEWSDGRLSLAIQDSLKNLSWAKFVWDYENMGEALGGSEWYGTVTGISGSNVYWNDAYGTKYITRTKVDPWTAFAALAFTLWGPKQAGAYLAAESVYNKRYRRFYDLDVIPDDYIIEGDYMKFSVNNFAGSEAGGTLMNHPQYQVRGGTVISNIGTIELAPAPLENDVAAGHFMYVRRPLIFAGNPADIIWDILTGTNTDVGWDTTADSSNIDIDYPLWLESRSSLMPLGGAEYFTIIEEEGTGAVLGAIQEISQDCLANAFIDNESKFVWKSYHPRTVPIGTDLTHYHQATSVADLVYWENIEDVYTKFVLDYDYLTTEPDERIQWGGRIEEVDTAATAAYYDLNRVKHWQSRWIKDRNFARQQILRTMRRYGDGPSRVSFDSSLYGLLGTVTGFMGVTHTTGSLGTTVHEITRTERNFGDRRVILEGLNASDLYYGKGFGFWEENPDGGTGPGTSTATLWDKVVSGTSTWGWGTNTGTLPVGTEGTCYNIDTSIYGTIFKWW